MDSLLKTSIFKDILSFSDTYRLLPHNTTIIVGFSGGPDSVFLMHVLHAIKKERNLKIVAVHIDHQWRTESTQDANWCERFCAQLEIPYQKTTLAAIAYEPRNRGSLEEYARKKRRFYFEHIAQERGAHSIALAHHKQDQQETFFIRLLRGTSLSGLTGMQPQEGLYIRPLLCLDKTDILTYLHAHHIAYLTDQSNDSPDFLRNRIRATVLPALRACDIRFDKTFFATLQRLQESDQFLQKRAHETLAVLKENAPTLHALNYQLLVNQNPVLQYRILVLWFKECAVPFEPSHALFEEILRFLKKGKRPSHQIYSTWKIQKKDQWIFIEK